MLESRSVLEVPVASRDGMRFDAEVVGDKHGRGRPEQSGRQVGCEESWMTGASYGR